MPVNPIEAGLVTLLGKPNELAVNSPWVDRLLFFRGIPKPNMTLVVTAGMSRHALHQTRLKALRHELMVIHEDSLDGKLVGALLLSIAKEVVERKHAIVRGEVFGPAGPLFPGSEMSALFATKPVFLPESRFCYPMESETHLGIWLVAISSTEAASARALGPREFEAYLEDLGGRRSIWGFLRTATGAH